MKKIGYIAMLVSLPAIAIGQNNGIEHTNYKVGVARSNSAIGSSSALFGEIRLPVFEYTGISLAGTFSKFSGSENFIDSSSKSAFFGVFLRDDETGIIQANFARSNSENDAPFNTTIQSSNQYSLDGTYYINNFDISLSRSISKSDAGNTANVSGINFGYYINDNLLTSIGTMGMDFNNAYVVDISFQPEILNQSTSMVLNYLKTDFETQLGIAFVYYFDTRVSLIERNRKY